MKNSVIMAMVLGSTFGLMSEARAQYIDYQTLSPDFIVSVRQNTSFDKLRGIIEHEGNNHFVTAGKFTKNSHEYRSDLEGLDSGIQAEKLQSANQPIDSLITGKSNYTNFYRKFDSDGNPLAHHQEYSRPSIKNLASSLWKAMEINPYPGDQ